MLPPGKQFICFKFIITRQVTQKGSILFLFISTLGIDVFFEWELVILWEEERAVSLHPV